MFYEKNKKIQFIEYLMEVIFLKIIFSNHTGDFFFFYISFNAFESFSHQRQQMVFHWSLSDYKSHQVSRTLLSILSDLNNTLGWMDFTRPLISKSSSPCTRHFLTLASAPITIGIAVTFMLHSLFSFQAKSHLLFSLSFIFTLSSSGTAKSIIRQVLFLFFAFFVDYHKDRLIGLVGRMFANGPGDLGLIPGRVIPKTLKMVLDTSLLNTQHYKVRIKGKEDKSRERSSALPYISV